VEVNPGGRVDLWTAAVESENGQLKAGKPEVFLQTSANTAFPEFSPDGRWIAYESWESGISEIYVRAFPKRDEQWQISNSGGTWPLWSRNSRELFYHTEDQRIMVAAYTVKGDSFVPDKPRLWAVKRLAAQDMHRTLDIAPDGKRFVVLIPAEGAEEQNAQNHVTFLLNFFDELRRRVPTGAK
jgi:serine/threonine-protein kinase